MLSFLIFSRWLQAEARALDVHSKAAVAKRRAEDLLAESPETVPYEHLAGDGAELRGLMLSRGLSLADATWLVGLAELQPKVENARLERARAAVGIDAVKRFYVRHRQRFFHPDERDLEIIGTNTVAAAQRAKRQIEAGKSFLEVARRVSIDVEAPGGLWHLVRGRDEPQVEGPVFAAKPNVLIGPKSYSIYYIFKVLRVIPAHEEPLAHVEDAIRAKIGPTPRQVHSRFEAEWTQRTSCAPEFVVRRCREKQNAPRASHRRKHEKADNSS